LISPPDFVTLDELVLLYDYFGYAGFIISILFFLPIPYFPLALIAAFNKNLDPHLIALSGTAGAVAAKMIIFYLAYSGHNFIVRKSKGRTMSLQKLLSKYGWIGAFVATICHFPEISSTLHWVLQDTIHGSLLLLYLLESYYIMSL
jgi:membrane protein DedA with SNARE-associated domain